MSYQDDARALSRIEQLLKRGDVAVDVCRPCEVYYYRPQQVLCRIDDLPIVDAAITNTFPKWAPQTKPRPANQAVHRWVAQPPRSKQIQLSDLGLGRRFLPHTVSVPGFIEYLRHKFRLNEPQSVQPNYILMGSQWWGGEPGDDPEPIAPLREPNELQPCDPSGCTVGVIDTGIEDDAASHHPRFGGSLILTPGDVDTLDADGNAYLDRQAGHGTFVAGVVRDRASSCRIQPERGLDPDGVGDVTTIAGILRDMAATQKVPVINLSLGGYSKGDELPAGLETALDVCEKAGVVVVAAAGNDNSNRPFYPAASPRKFVVSVGALKSASENQPVRAPFSNYGSWVKAWAPGWKIKGLYVDGAWDPANTTSGAPPVFSGYARWSGTSFAAPRVAAAIAEDLDQNGGSAYDAWQRVSAAGTPGPAGGGGGRTIL